MEREPIGREELEAFTRTLLQYRAGKTRTEQRILEAESWWKLRNGTAPGEGFRSRSGWLHNVIHSKHADAMDSYPIPLILPREKSDTAEAEVLSAILPCILEQNGFENTYSEVIWQKLKYGTGCYRVCYDYGKLNGLGDISIRRANLLNLFWEPGITDIQESRYFFDTELREKDLLTEEYPQLKDKPCSGAFTAPHFRYDDRVNNEGKVTVIGVYYHKNGLLHYCKYTGDTVLESTENDPALRERGLYDHGKYPFVFDPLFPIEGSPCGYGYVDLCRGPQTEIDLIRTAMVQNAAAGAMPRYFLRTDGSINEEEYLDLHAPIVHVDGNLGEDSIRAIPHTALDNSYLNLLRETVTEMRETSGNTETSTGTVNGSLTAAAAISALQEAAGKTTRDSVRGTYRAFCRLTELCIELIRQFYDLPRQFRITGPTPRFTEYTNRGIRPQRLQCEGGFEAGYRVPLFDIRVEAAKKPGYSEASQNELALQLYKLGFFLPGNERQALGCMEMMSFQGKETLRDRLQKQLQAESTLPQTAEAPAAAQ